MGETVKRRSKVHLAGLFLLSLPTLLTGCGETLMGNVRPDEYQIPSYVPMPPPAVARTDGSLWPGEGRSSILFADNRARYVNDIVTITVNESAEGTKDVTTKTSNKSDNSAAIKAFLGLPLNLGIKNLVGLGTALDPSYETTKSNSYDGSGSTTRKGELKASISTRVVDLFPNGNLRIAGKREVVINNERQILILTGVIRPEDIQASNTIQSTYVADAKIILTGQGVAQEKQHPGWMARVLDEVWPF